MRLVTQHLTKGQIQCLAELQRRGLYSSRSDAVRNAVNDLIKLHLTPEERLRLSRRAVKH